MRATVCGGSRCGFPCLDNEDLTLNQGILLGHSTATHHNGSNNSGKYQVIYVDVNEIITLGYLDYGRQLKVDILGMYGLRSESYRWVKSYKPFECLRLTLS